MLLTWNTVGNIKLCTGVVFRKKEVNLFLMSLTDVTIQDGSIREQSFFLNLLLSRSKL